ncbi:MAG: hypothetical protein IT434_09695 [Phycisphaerales bacterium]|jgi:hypothetical protein|nr:hypothetical protein [Phycisphaerales bacterium]
MNHDTTNQLRLSGESGPDPADRAVESALDQLGLTERLSAPSTLEARLLASTQALLAKSGAVEASPVIARVRSFSWSLRIAAAIAVMACAGAAWLAVRPAAPASATASTVAALEEDIDAIITTASFADAGFADELDKLDADTLNFGQSSSGQDWLDLIEETSL